MASERMNDLQAFKGFLDETLSHGGAEMTLDEALDRWEYENSPEADREATREAIQRGFDDLNAGRTVDAFEFAARMRRKFPNSEKP